jgi:DNA-binding transcriptional regulator GbsR (MarR family)
MNVLNEVTSRSEMGTEERADDARRRFVERFALLLTEAGLPRMPARAFACLLAEDSGQLTAAELAERLEVSPAAISGAVRYLTRVGMVMRDREPGARRDHYRLHDEPWADMYRDRGELMRRWQRETSQAVALLGPDTPAGRRLQESHEYFVFLEEELNAIAERWRQRKASR